MRKRHRIKCQNQEYQRLKQDFCIFSGCKTINLPRIIFTLVQKAVMQAMLTTLPELNLFKADAKTAPKARQWHFALLKLLLQLQEFTFKDTAGRNATGLLRNPCTNLAITRAAMKIFHHFESRKSFCFTAHHHLALKGMPREQQANARIIFDLMCFTASEVGVKQHVFFVVKFE